MVARVQDLGLDLVQRQSGKAHLIGGGLAMDKAVRKRWCQHLFGMRRGGFNEIAQHIVVLDLQTLHASLLNILGLHRRNHATAFVAQSSRFVQFCIIACGHKAAIPRKQRRFGNQRRIQQINQGTVAQQRLTGVAQNLWHIAQPRRDAFGLGQPRTNGRKVARPAAVKRQPRQRAVNIRHAAQIRPQILAQRCGIQ